MAIRGLSIQPRRIEFDIENAPATLPLLVHILCGGRFIHGWVQVPGFCESISTRLVPVVGVRPLPLPPPPLELVGGSAPESSVFGWTGGLELAQTLLIQASVPPFRKNCDT